MSAEITTFQKELMLALYQRWFHQGDTPLLILDEWAARKGLTFQQGREEFGLLVEQGLAIWHTIMAVSLTGSSVRWLEAQDWAPANLVQLNRDVQERLLFYLADLYEAERPLRRQGAQIVTGPIDRDIANALGVSNETLDGNARILQFEDLIIRRGSFSYVITTMGLAWVSNRRQWGQFRDEFENLRLLKDVSRQQRGHRLERLIADVARMSGWEAETNVLANGEENDLIIFRDREYYIVQSKWEQDPIQPAPLSVLRDRITARVGLRGIFVSISGFTEQAVADAIGRLEAAMILLFGPGDVEDIITSRKSFSHLLSEKYHQAATRRYMLIDGKVEQRLRR